MNVRWKKLLLKTTFWLATEICFTLIGIDDLVDYSEFIFGRQEIVQLLSTSFTSLSLATLNDKQTAKGASVNLAGNYHVYYQQA